MADGGLPLQVLNKNNIAVTVDMSMTEVDVMVAEQSRARDKKTYNNMCNNNNQHDRNQLHNG